MILKDGYDWFKNMQIRWRRITLNIIILTSSNNIQKDSKLKDKKSEMTEVIWKVGLLTQIIQVWHYSKNNSQSTEVRNLKV